MNKNKNININKAKIIYEKYAKTNENLLKYMSQLDNRINTFLSISLGVFSLQITLLSGSLFSAFKYYADNDYQLIAFIAMFLLLSNIALNFMSVLNFRISTKISEQISIDENDDNNNTNYNEIQLYKSETKDVKRNIIKNQIFINNKKYYISKGLNYIILCMLFISFSVIFSL